MFSATPPLLGTPWYPIDLTHTHVCDRGATPYNDWMIQSWWAMEDIAPYTSTVVDVCSPTIVLCSTNIPIMVQKLEMYHLYFTIRQHYCGCGQWLHFSTCSEYEYEINKTQPILTNQAALSSPKNHPQHQPLASAVSGSKASRLRPLTERSKRPTKCTGRRSVRFARPSRVPPAVKFSTQTNGLSFRIYPAGR